MKHEPTPATIDSRRVAVVMRELSLDLLRALEAAVPYVLADAAADLGPDRLSWIAARMFRNIKARYAVNVAATLLAARSGGHQ